MWSPRATNDWFGDGESSSEGRPSTAASSATYVTAKSSSTLNILHEHGPQPTLPHQHGSSGHAAALPNIAAPPPAVDVLPALLTDLNRTDDAAIVGDAAMHLCLLLDSATGDEAATLGAALRASGPRGLARIVSLLDETSRAPLVHQSCLLLLANLAAPDIDPTGAIASDLKSLDALRRMIAHVSSSEVLTVAYALGAIRNNANSLNCVELMSRSGTIDALQALANGQRSVEDPSGRLRNYAAGCLINVRQIMADHRDAQSPR